LTAEAVIHSLFILYIWNFFVVSICLPLLVGCMIFITFSIGPKAWPCSRRCCANLILTQRDGFNKIYCESSTYHIPIQEHQKQGPEMLRKHLF
jgi:Na+/serine symporter